MVSPSLSHYILSHGMQQGGLFKAFLLFCRQFLHITRSRFNVVFVDKDGVDRDRYIQPVTPEELFSFVDTYLLTSQEELQREQNKDMCN